MTKTACIISQLSLDFPDKSMFNHLDFTLYAQQTSAIIGRNGFGKSLLFKILHFQSTSALPYMGQVSWHTQHEYLPQIHRLDASNIAEALNVDTLYFAFKRIQQNTATYEDFDLVENQWHLPQHWNQQLSEANLPTDLEFPIQQLSEGQKTKLALCGLFLKKDHFLLLDEPSNHLDAKAREWLISCIRTHTAGVCIISHDRQLLNQVQHIYALNEHGLQHITGNYADYIHQYQMQTSALQQTIQHEKRHVKQLKQQQHAQQLKVQKKQQQGQKLRDSHSQAKVLLDFKKEQSGQSLGKMKTQQQRHMQEAQVSLKDKQMAWETIKPQKFEFQFKFSKQGEIFRIDRLNLPYTQVQPIQFSLHAHQKIHICGENGIGKSTLIQMIHHKTSSKIFFSGQSLYLDQSLSLLNDELSILENLNQFNPALLTVEWRNLLGQMRIRGDKATLLVSALSGGEKLKLLLLGLSQSQQHIDLLLLDEPENHLDIESRDLLAHAISSFAGAVILISHDAFFVKQCGITDRYVIKNESF